MVKVRSRRNHPRRRAGRRSRVCCLRNEFGERRRSRTPRRIVSVAPQVARAGRRGASAERCELTENGLSAPRRRPKGRTRRSPVRKADRLLHLSCSRQKAEKAAPVLVLVVVFRRARRHVRVSPAQEPDPNAAFVLFEIVHHVHQILLHVLPPIVQHPLALASHRLPTVAGEVRAQLQQVFPSFQFHVRDLFRKGVCSGNGHETAPVTFFVLCRVVSGQETWIRLLLHVVSATSRHVLDHRAVPITLQPTTPEGVAASAVPVLRTFVLVVGEE
mmetsp:Transcript_26391/g.66569  ORF Transcript_26391/g.66569 Transcript_26391/m.66569 type:complete len:273 (+) Transcript_26391:1000-1818(+)